MNLLDTGFGNYIAVSRIVAIVSPDSAPTRRLITESRDMGQLIDATFGRRTRAVIRTDDGHTTLSALLPKTLADRLSDVQ